MDYKYQLLTPEWKRKREHILSSRGWKCERCGSKEKLHVHHSFYIKGRMAWEYDDHQLNVLCLKCHRSIHGINHKNKTQQIPDSSYLKMSCFKCGYFKVPRSFMVENAVYSRKFVSFLLSYIFSLNGDTLSYDRAMEKFNIRRNSFLDAVKYLEKNGSICVERKFNKSAKRSHLNRYRLKNHSSEYKRIPSCLLLSTQLTNREKTFIISNFWFLIKQSESGGFSIKDIIDEDVSIKRSWLYNLFKEKYNQHSCFIIRKIKEGRYEINKDYLFKIDEEAKSCLCLTREELTQLNEDAKKH